MSNIIDKLLIFLFSHQTKLKMLYFQTENYSYRKIINDYINVFTNQMDKLIEVCQGVFCNCCLEKLNIDVYLLNDKTVSDSINYYVKMMKSLDDVFKDHKEILTIRDDMINEAHKLKYLFKLK